MLWLKPNASITCIFNILHVDDFITCIDFSLFHYTIASRCLHSIGLRYAYIKQLAYRNLDSVQPDEIIENKRKIHVHITGARFPYYWCSIYFVTKIAFRSPYPVRSDIISLISGLRIYVFSFDSIWLLSSIACNMTLY